MAEDDINLGRLRSAAQEHVRHRAKTAELEACLPESVIAPTISGDLNLPFLAEHIHRLDGSKELRVHQDIIFIEACLRNPRVIIPEPSDRHAATLLRKWTAEAILPSQSFAERSRFNTDQAIVLQPSEVARKRAMGVAGLCLLSHLQAIAPVSLDEDIVTLTSCLASFTDERDAWNSPEASKEAFSLIEDYLNLNEDAPERRQDLLSSVLQEKVKPLFAKSKNPAITQQGRKVMQPIPGKFETSDQEVEIKPWKFDKVYIVTVFRWVLARLDVSTVETNWPLVIPPLLTLIDDSTTKYKVKGCELLILFLKIVPSNLLQRTGLGEVFQAALIPCLLYLPALTPEEESLQLLTSVYPALMALTRVRYPVDTNQAEKNKTLDKIVRDGVLKGYAHAGEHVKIAEVLIRNLSELISEMGIASVKHLKHIIPLISSILAAPFATAYPPLLTMAVVAIEVIIKNDWPRVAYHRGTILEGLIICWCRIGEEELSSDLDVIRDNLEYAMELLGIAIKENIDFTEEYRILVKSDIRLQDLLTV